MEAAADSGGGVPGAATAGGTLAELTRAECLSLLATQPVGRLGVTIQALPAILPVNFALLRGRIIIRTVAGSKLEAAVAQCVVAFEVDSYHPSGGSGWSVLVRGRAREITDPRDLADIAGLALPIWVPQDGAASRFLQIEPAQVTGRRFGEDRPPADVLTLRDRGHAPAVFEVAE